MIRGHRRPSGCKDAFALALRFEALHGQLDDGFGVAKDDARQGCSVGEGSRSAVARAKALILDRLDVVLAVCLKSS